MGLISKIVVVGVVGYLGYYAWKLNDRGYFLLPEIPNGAYPISFENGFRGIVHDIEATNINQYDAPKILRRLTLATPDRRYLNVPADVPEWFEKAWSTCRRGTEEERANIEGSIPQDIKDSLVGARLDALCFIEFDDQEPLFRGLIYSIPAM